MATKNTGPRYTPANPGPAATSLAKYISENKDHTITAADAQAFLSFHAEWQRNRGPEREALAAERAAKKAADKLAKDAKDAEDIAARYANLVNSWLAAEVEFNASQKPASRKSA